ncbi:MAG TPA: phBC6A51 family helix-turn-helix protein [Flavobacterium sp.]|nr:phBC6A51 family helix-turn-helix protein [Flavobacterium sp.]
MNPTESDVYQPTKAEEKLLKVLVNPDFIGATVANICQEAGISRETYYQAFKKPGFCELQERLAKDLIKQAVNPIINACIKEAKNGSFQHAKLLMEMGHMYTPKQLQEVTGKNGGPIETKSSMSALSTEELRQLAQLK